MYCMLSAGFHFFFYGEGEKNKINSHQVCTELSSKSLTKFLFRLFKESDFQRLKFALTHLHTTIKQSNQSHISPVHPDELTNIPPKHHLWQ